MSRASEEYYYRAYAFGHRREGMSHAEFDEYWRHPHGSIAPQIGLLTGYMQNHILEGAEFGLAAAPWDGIPEMYFATIGNLHEFRTDPVVVERLLPDEPNIADMARSEFLATTAAFSHDLTDDDPDTFAAIDYRPTMIKVFQIIADEDSPRSPDDLVDLAKSIGASRISTFDRIEEIDYSTKSIRQLREFIWPTIGVFAQAVKRNPQHWATMRNDSGAHYTILAQTERWRVGKEF